MKPISRAWLAMLPGGGLPRCLESKRQIEFQYGHVRFDLLALSALTEVPIHHIWNPCVVELWQRSLRSQANPSRKTYYSSCLLPLSSLDSLSHLKTFLLHLYLYFPLCLKTVVVCHIFSQPFCLHFLSPIEDTSFFGCCYMFISCHREASGQRPEMWSVLTAGACWSYWLECFSCQENQKKMIMLWHSAMQPFDPVAWIWASHMLRHVWCNVRLFFWGILSGEAADPGVCWCGANYLHALLWLDGCCLTYLLVAE